MVAHANTFMYLRPFFQTKFVQRAHFNRSVLVSQNIFTTVTAKDANLQE